jgi:hypothetical protein
MRDDFDQIESDSDEDWAEASVLLAAECMDAESWDENFPDQT